jgi:hypothetical protein
MVCFGVEHSTLKNLVRVAVLELLSFLVDGKFWGGTKHAKKPGQCDFVLVDVPPFLSFVVLGEGSLHFSLAYRASFGLL